MLTEEASAISQMYASSRFQFQELQVDSMRRDTPGPHNIHNKVRLNGFEWLPNPLHRVLLRLHDA